MKHIIEKIKTQTNWGKNQLLQFLEPEIKCLEENVNYQSKMCDIPSMTITSRKLEIIEELIDYIKTKSTHGSTELRLKFLDIIGEKLQ